MSIWAARDKDGTLAFFGAKPSFDGRTWVDAYHPDGEPASSWEWSAEYGDDPFGETLRWDHAPIEVKIRIEEVG